jgi:hypothetical integral membrane protein (TIGR02206 family)
MDAREFQPFGVSHWVAIAATLIVAGALLRWFRDPATPDARKWLVRRIFAFVLCLAVILDPILAWLRFGAHPGTAWSIIRGNTLPLFLCDVVAVMLAFALVTGNRRLAEAGFIWSIAGTVQGLITPTLHFDWTSPEYYAFFAEHGGGPVAGLILVFGLGLVPQAGYFARMLCWSWGYMAVVMALNVLLGTNYGFLNGKPAVPTPLDHMGAWPIYLFTLQLVAFPLYLVIGESAIRIIRRFPPPNGADAHG